jgi:hypothetical protein
MAGYTIPAGVLALLSFLAVDVNAASSFTCGASGSGGSYNATTKYLGCFLDPTVSILGDAKLGTISMTPQYCANWCGARGYAYGGVEFGSCVSIHLIVLIFNADIGFQSMFLRKNAQLQWSDQH